MSSTARTLAELGTLSLAAFVATTLVTGPRAAPAPGSEPAITAVSAELSRSMTEATGSFAEFGRGAFSITYGRSTP